MRAPARELFRDAAFPASDSSLFSSFSTPLAQFREEITWRRPQEICATPQLFADRAQEGQVKQGLLGDCWFLCACAALQKSQHLLDQVFPPGQPSWLDQTYRGSFTCRVWQFGRWVEVTIDDRLPCLAGRLCFSRCQREDVFWLPLLEKVYAKVYGSYEHLWAGQVADALVDLTGGLAERWNLKDMAGTSGQQDRPRGAERRTCRQLLSLKDRCLLSCSVLRPRTVSGVADPPVTVLGAALLRTSLIILNEDRGPEKGMTRQAWWQPSRGLNPGTRALGEFHAFIVSDLRELRGRAGQSIVLLRIQNPWGRRCWQGPWREGGEGWNRVESEAQSELLSQLQEGEFWVEEDEFLREFDEVTIGFPISEAGHLQSLCSGRALCHTQELPGAWVKGQSAGGCRNYSGFPSNPKFWLRVCEPSEVYMAVLQRPQLRTAGRPGRDYQAVGLHIWKVEKRRVSLPKALSAPPVAGTACHAYDREVHLRCELAPGYYLAVPSTFLKDMPGRFLLRVFSSGRVCLSAIQPAAQSAAPREALPVGEWETVRLRGSWRVGRTAGGSRNFASYPTNPRFPLSVPEGAGPRCVRITLRQHCRDREVAIGFHVFQAGAPAPGRPGGVSRVRERGPPGSVRIIQSHARLISRFPKVHSSLGVTAQLRRPLVHSPGLRTTGHLCPELPPALHLQSGGPTGRRGCRCPAGAALKPRESSPPQTPGLSLEPARAWALGTSREGTEGRPTPAETRWTVAPPSEGLLIRKTRQSWGWELRARPRCGAESQAVGGWGGLRELGEVCRLSLQRRGCLPGSRGPEALPTGGRRPWRPGEGQGVTNAAPSAFPGLSQLFLSRHVNGMHLADV
ncbi:calpain-10 isoform X1 [Neophocaena asiaeorientalis asiaeorientalis]|uniref:Calpain-10 isoform X1 n=2 Tax=Neophocaena asiaeorientalis asiaeorientalis TaxID=1706337 RepID=A0A341CRI3_NEOAA|nr:calpain-10 isoform X1 [Neophocaena asiaeorientalis asiaeorientalis]XP_024617443.1 calpain-10 isoform X1 [Neophocaena asiaeorientalis asiaeorientalis]